MKPLPTTIGQILRRCELVLVYAAVAATAAMMLLTSTDALCRYLLNSPILGAYEITEKYLVVAMVFLGLSYAYRGGVFIRVTFLIDRLPRGGRLAADHVSHALSVGFLALTILMLIDLPRVRRGEALLFAQDTPES
jgi:TRAP-type C4-dicarboxylate transport system permease small subunit